MQYKALPWLRVSPHWALEQSANIWRRDWNVKNAIIEVLVLRNPRTLSNPPGTTVSSRQLSLYVETGNRNRCHGLFHPPSFVSPRVK